MIGASGEGMGDPPASGRPQPLHRRGLLSAAVLPMLGALQSLTLLAQWPCAPGCMTP